MELANSGLMSSTSTVPAAVPSVFHSSVPVTVKAEKKTVSPTTVSSAGTDEPRPGLMSLTSTVPAAVPSLFHSSEPMRPIVLAK